MDSEPKSLFTKGKVSSLGKLYGKWKVKKQGSPVEVELHDKGLVEMNSYDSSTKTI